MIRNQEPNTHEKFRPDVYIQQYYAYLGSENRAILRFLTREFQRCPPHARMLDFGCGPTIYQFIAAAPKVDTIHVADYYNGNLQAIQDWLDAKPGIFDWREYTRAVLALEATSAVDLAAIEQREQQVRQKLQRFLHCDLTSTPPISGVAEGSYDILMSNFCLEHIPPQEDFEARLGNVFALLRPGGRLILQFTRRMPSYPVGDVVFPCLPVDEDDFIRILPKHHFPARSIEYQIIEAEDGLQRPYGSFVTMAASKS
jgi:SAM-dependent methyltransferase